MYVFTSEVWLSPRPTRGDLPLVEGLSLTLLGVSLPSSVKTSLGVPRPLTADPGTDNDPCCKWGVRSRLRAVLLEGDGTGPTSPSKSSTKWLPALAPRGDLFGETEGESEGSNVGSAEREEEAVDNLRWRVSEVSLARDELDDERRLNRDRREGIFHLGGRTGQ